MSTQIAVRLADELVEFVDSLVRSGEACSRADVVQVALRRERRRRLAEGDAAIYAAEAHRAAAGDEDEFAEMRRFVADAHRSLD